MNIVMGRNGDELSHDDENDVIVIREMGVNIVMGRTDTFN